MDQLLRETKKVPMEEGRTHFHRGRHNEHHTLLKHVIGDNPERVVEGRDKSVRELFVESYAETRLETLYDGRARTVSRRLRTRFLRPIERRICQCTGLTSPDDVVRLPVYFDYYNPTQRTQSWGQALADSCTSNLVNMQVLNTDPDPHLLVPRPCGPRLPPEQTEDVVRSVLEEIGRGVPHVCRPQDKRDNQPGFPFWVWPNLTIDTLALFFTRRKQGGAFITDIERDQLIRLIKQGHAVHHLRGDLRKAVEATRRKILDANDLPPALLQNGRFTRWHRLFIPEDTVDVLEAYTQSVLEAIGCHVHFVDAWYYHSGHGGLHCATNVRHRPPATDAPEREGRPPWWATYPDLADANTIYDPHNTAHVERAQQHASP